MDDRRIIPERLGTKLQRLSVLHDRCMRDTRIGSKQGRGKLQR
jgi:hypothetical protein